MVLSKVGVALARIGVALFETGVARAAPASKSARATPKVYKSPPLDRPQILSYNLRDLFLEKPPANLLRFRLCIANSVTKCEDAPVRLRVHMENSAPAIDWD